MNPILRTPSAFRAKLARGIALALLLGCAPSAAVRPCRASVITNLFLDPGSNAPATVMLVFRLQYPVIAPWNGVTNAQYWTRCFTNCATNGVLVQPLGPGNWSVQIGPNRDPFSFDVPADNNTYSLWSLVGGGAIYTFTPAGAVGPPGPAGPAGLPDLATNAAFPSPLAGSGIFATSNYDLYWITPNKTNLIILGH